MKVIFLVPDIAGPVLGPVTSLAQLIEYEVGIVGPDFGRGVPEMYRDVFSYTVLPAGKMYRFPDFFREAQRLVPEIRGDLIIAVKAYANTVLPALWARKSFGSKVIAYLDEWDGALMKMRTPMNRLRQWLMHALHPLEDPYYPWVERILPRCDWILSTSTFLKKKFGGSIIHAGVDTEVYKPGTAGTRNAMRHTHGLENKKVILFGGVAREHKGLRRILKALSDIADPRMILVVVGPETEYLKSLMNDPAIGHWLLHLGSRPKADMPRYLDMADLFVLLQENTLLAQSQVPCKLFEAMAMGKPMVVSDVSDLSSLVGPSGWVVSPNDNKQLRQAIRNAAYNASGDERGRAMRERAEKLYSKEKTKNELLKVLNDISIPKNT